jgi:ankyrin repeat protein
MQRRTHTAARILRILAYGIALAALLVGMSGCASQIHKAAKDNDLKTVEEQLAGEASIDQRDRKGRTPLVVAAENGNEELVRYLVEQGADIDAESKVGGWTALRWSVTKGNVELTEFLIEHGADVNQENEFGWTPLHSAAKYGQDRIVAMLLEAGADLSAKTESGRTPARVASERGYIDITVYLLLEQRERGMDILDTAPTS